ncbi:MAG: HDIG domain-containing protein [Deltaproteobacteria bacterium]|nr:MAG: HDIG domain-containing protein [Deltaproteobacteria bacterium]
MSLIQHLRALGARPGAGRAGSVLLLALACTLVALLTINYGGRNVEKLSVGDVAPRTVRADRSFTYADEAAWEAQKVEAAASVRPVFRHQTSLLESQRSAVTTAFADAREDLLAAYADHGLEEPTLQDLPAEVRSEIREVFRKRLGVNLPDASIDTLLRSGLPDEARDLALTLLEDASRRFVVADREVLPGDRGAITVIDDLGEERTVRDLGTILEPNDVRRELEVRKAVLRSDASWGDAAAEVARSLVTPNLFQDLDALALRRQQASESVEPAQVLVKRGTVLFRDGEELGADSVARYHALQRSVGSVLGLEIVAVTFFLALVMLALVHFGVHNLRRFSLSVRDVAAVGALLVLMGLLTRVGVGLSGGIASLVSYGCEPQSVWFVVPIAGVPMLVRLLVGVNWALVAGLLSAAVAGLLMDLDGLMVLFAMISAVIATGAVDHTRERLAVLKAGLVVGSVNAALALLIHFIGIFLGDGAPIESLGPQPLWSMGFAFLGGLLASFMVLVLMPVFERLGFVTDYRLMELANLNHPLMKQLMLRAPGSYHHSVVVGSLAEAACEEVGANALQTRVAAYFHDIGKALKPQYFVENQGAGTSRHAGLDPHTSAAIIISHVTDGAELARRYRLPKPCLDNIYMHHGTGLLQYFYARAVEQADDEEVDESAFRYPGPKPDSRESGILMLADKVEAATRTIKEPTEEKFRSMIHAIINSVMADDQFANCPLTFRELYKITDAFVGVLLGIHHQRIEYPQTAHLSAKRRDVPPPPSTPEIITLELPTEEQLRQPSPVPARQASSDPARQPSPVPARQASSDPARQASSDPARQASSGSASRPSDVPQGDYESVEYLPGSDSGS